MFDSFLVVYCRFVLETQTFLSESRAFRPPKLVHVPSTQTSGILLVNSPSQRPYLRLFFKLCCVCLNLKRKLGFPAILLLAHSFLARVRIEAPLFSLVIRLLSTFARQFISLTSLFRFLTRPVLLRAFSREYQFGRTFI